VNWSFALVTRYCILVPKLWFQLWWSLFVSYKSRSVHVSFVAFWSDCALIAISCFCWYITSRQYSLCRPNKRCQPSLLALLELRDSSLCVGCRVFLTCVFVSLRSQVTGALPLCACIPHWCNSPLSRLSCNSLFFFLQQIAMLLEDAHVHKLLKGVISQA
jgi:hypothetical protein